MDPRVWKSLRPGQRPKPVPRMSREEIGADYARREVERQAKRIQQQAELERARLEHQAGVQPTPAPSETTLEGFTETQL